MGKLKKLFLLCLFTILFVALLRYPKACVSYALSGLTSWFNHMVPTLLPFMILSQLLIKLNLHTYFVRLFQPILGPLYRMSPHGIYVLIIGFSCGFPTGAKTCVSLYEKGYLTKEEGNYLLSFTNLIGPIYFISFALPLLQITNKIPYIFGMYGIALCYGLFLRYTFYYNKIPSPTQLTSKVPTTTPAFFSHLDSSICDSLWQIAMLGGYMILFQTFNILPTLFHLQVPIIQTICNLLTEITNGLCALPTGHGILLYEFLGLLGITFGGFCCLAQTYNVLQGTNLSKWTYFLHKCILTCITCLYYILLY